MKNILYYAIMMAVFFANNIGYTYPVSNRNNKLSYTQAHKKIKNTKGKHKKQNTRSYGAPTYLQKSHKTAISKKANPKIERTIKQKPYQQVTQIQLYPDSQAISYTQQKLQTDNEFANNDDIRLIENCYNEINKCTNNPILYLNNIDVTQNGWKQLIPITQTIIHVIVKLKPIIEKYQTSTDPIINNQLKETLELMREKVIKPIMLLIQHNINTAIQISTENMMQFIVDVDKFRLAQINKTELQQTFINNKTQEQADNFSDFSTLDNQTIQNKIDYFKQYSANNQKEFCLLINIVRLYDFMYFTKNTNIVNLIDDTYLLSLSEKSRKIIQNCIKTLESCGLSFNNKKNKTCNYEDFINRLNDIIDVTQD